MRPCTGSLGSGFKDVRLRGRSTEVSHCLSNTAACCWGNGVASLCTGGMVDEGMQMASVAALWQFLMDDYCISKCARRAPAEFPAVLLVCDS